MPPLNPAAATFNSGSSAGYFPHATHPTATPRLPSLNLSHVGPSNVGQALSCPTEPAKPLPRYGDNWRSSFPPKKSTAVNKHNPHLLTPSENDSFPRPSLLRAKSPSLPCLLPPKRDVNTNHTTTHRHSFQALAAISPRRTSPGTNTSSSGSPKLRFAPFDDDVDVVSQAVNIGAGLHTPQSPIASSSTSLFSEYLGSTHTTSSESSCSLENDIGEGRNVYISDLPSDITSKALRKFGQQFGRVVSVKVEHGDITPDTRDMLPEGAGRSHRSYAFVMFDSALASQRFMTEMSKLKISCQLGKETPHLKQKALEDPHSSNLYVAEIPLDFTEDEMGDLMAPGQISSLRFLEDGSKNRRGTAMVRLQSRVQAEEAIARLDLRFTLRGCSKPLQVRIADSENQKAYKKKTVQSRMTPSVESLRHTLVTPKPVAAMPLAITDFDRTDFGLPADTAQKVKHIINLQKYHVDSRGLDKTPDGSPTDSDWWRPYTTTTKTRFNSPPNPTMRLMESLAQRATPRRLPSWDPGFHIPHAPAPSVISSGPSTPTSLQEDMMYPRLVNVRP